LVNDEFVIGGSLTNISGLRRRNISEIYLNCGNYGIYQLKLSVFDALRKLAA